MGGVMARAGWTGQISRFFFFLHRMEAYEILFASGVPTIFFFQDCSLQSGPKVLDHWGVITNDFPRSPFSMLIHIILARTPLLSATLKQGVGRGNWIWIQGLGVTIPLENRQKINVSTVNGWMKLKRERRSNDFWPWLSERVSKYCI